MNRLTFFTLVLISITFVLSFFFQGCATQTRCLAKFPPDTIIKVETNTVTEWKDSTVFVHIPGDSVFVYDTTYIFPEPVTFQPLTARLPLAHSRAWIDAGRLNLGLWIDSTTLQFKLDSAKATVSTTQTITETVIVEKPVKEKWPRVLVWVFGGAVLALLVLLIILFKVK